LNDLGLCSFLNVIDQVSHPYKIISVNQSLYASFVPNCWHRTCQQCAWFQVILSLSLSFILPSINLQIWKQSYNV
jgi:hypothetical protein